MYPAVAVVEALESRGRSGLEVWYVGSPDGIESGIAPRHGYRFEPVATGRLRGISWMRIPIEVMRGVRGTFEALRIVGQFRPQVILATGGYVSAPAVFAGWIRKVPRLLYLPDLTPGWAVTVLARFASRIAVSFPESQELLPGGRTIVTGYPVRGGIRSASKEEARRALDLPAAEKVLLVLGGSQGALRINRAVSAIREELLQDAMVIHIAGSADREAMAKEAARLPDRLRERYRLYGYLHEEIGSALAAADLALGRAGASILGELPAAGLPSVLVPYPSAGRHQAQNAQYLASHRAAIVLEEEELGERLLPTLRTLLLDDLRRREMAAAARQLATPGSADALASALESLAGIA
ncbi:MAG: glycosyltransferase [Anaerolineae bacterium]